MWWHPADPRSADTLGMQANETRKAIWDHNPSGEPSDAVVDLRAMREIGSGTIRRTKGDDAQRVMAGLVSIVMQSDPEDPISLPGGPDDIIDSAEAFVEAGIIRADEDGRGYLSAPDSLGAVPGVAPMIWTRYGHFLGGDVIDVQAAPDVADEFLRNRLDIDLDDVCDCDFECGPIWSMIEGANPDGTHPERPEPLEALVGARVDGTPRTRVYSAVDVAGGTMTDNQANDLGSRH